VPSSKFTSGGVVGVCVFSGQGGAYNFREGGAYKPLFLWWAYAYLCKDAKQSHVHELHGQTVLRKFTCCFCPPPPPTFTCSCACVVCLYVGVRVWCMYPDKIMSKVPCARECTCEHGCVGVWVVGEMYTTF